MKKIVSKMTIAAMAATMAIANMVSVSASANDGIKYNQITEIGTAGSSIKNFVSGTWYSASATDGIMDYNFDPTTMTGSIYFENKSTAKTFTYSYDGYTLSLYYTDGTVATATVIFGTNQMTLTWATGCVDVLTTAYPTVKNTNTTTTKANATKILATGTWYSSGTADGIVDYVFNTGKQSGSIYKENTGKSLTFTYDFDGSKANFYYSDGTTTSATVVFGNNEMTFTWATGCVDKFTIAYPTASSSQTKTPAKTVNIFAQGNWYSRDMSGVIDYWFDANTATGVRTTEGTNQTDNFTYDFSGDRLTFYYSNSTVSGTVSYDGYDIIVNWDNGFSERLSTTYPTVKEEKVKIFAQGNWYASGMDGIVDYFFNADSATGTRTNETTGFSEDFTYDFDGNKIVMYYGKYSVTGYVSYSGYDMIISWESGYSDTLSTVHPTVNIEPVVTTVEAPAETTATTVYDRYNQPMLARGTWYASSNSGIRTFCFDLLEPVGCMYDFDGTALNFEYTLNGADLEFHVIGAARGEHAKIAYNEDGTISLTWANGLFETLSTTQPTVQTTPAPVQTAPATQATQTVQTTVAVATKAAPATQTAPAPQTSPIVTSKAQQTKTTVQQSAVQQQTTPVQQQTSQQAVKKAPATTEAPKTGDNFPALAVAAVALIASAACAVTAKISRKK